MLLAVAMAVCLGVGAVSTAWAAGPQDNASTISAPPTVTFEGLKQGDELSAYRVAWYEDDFNKYVFGEQFGAYIDEAKGSEDVSREEWLSQQEEDISAVIDAFLSGRAASGAGAFAQGIAGENGRVSLALQPGYYVMRVKTTSENMNLYKPLTVFVEMVGKNQPQVSVAGNPLPTNGMVSMKMTEGLELVKRVRVSGSGDNSVWGTAATTQVGDEEKFYLKVVLPTLTEDSLIDDLDLEIVDIMTNLDVEDLNNLNLRAYRKEAGTIGQSGEKINDVISSCTYDSGKLTIKLDSQKMKDYDLFTGKYSDFFIAYDAVATAGVAKTGVASNTAVLKYTAGENPKETPARETHLYAYGFDVSKIKAMAGGGSLEGASFKVYRDLGGLYFRTSFFREGERRSGQCLLSFGDGRRFGRGRCF